MSRLFGTGGVRGVAGAWPLDPPTIARLGAAIVRGLEHGAPVRLIIGRDTRESGEWIERELARGDGLTQEFVGLQAPRPLAWFFPRLVTRRHLVVLADLAALPMKLPQNP